jgi:outer membrane receptor protein involved in Fe transport
MSRKRSFRVRRLRQQVLCAASLPILVGVTQIQQVRAADDGSILQEIVVTATRRSESLSRVPVSVAAFSQEQMDSQGLKQVDDLVRYTPGLVVSRGGNGANNISIRGISSGAGAGTTGVYIDDTPIQVRNLAYSSGTNFPALFDLERVEVLRGPQGTLFGAGSEGGTVRFIQTAPSLSNYSAYARGELSTTRGGDPSYEAGGAFGGPLVDGKIGFRLSAFYREDGGYIDGISGTPVVLDPSGNAGPASLTFAGRTVTRKNTNSVTNTGFRGALKFQVTDTLDITPSVTYQKTERADGFDTFWPAASSGSSNLARPVFNAGPASNPLLSPLASPDKDKGEDEFYLPALLLNWNLGPVEFVSNTSYFDRKSDQNLDFTQFYGWFYAVSDYPRPGDKASSLYHNGQRNFVQEMRLQSTDQDARFTWVAGVFYSDSKQRGIQHIGVNFLANAPEVGAFFLPFLDPPLPPAFTGGTPFGAGFSAFENYFGVPAQADSVLWSIDFRTRDRQLAGFAQTDFKVTDKLKLTTGVRVSRNKLDFNADYSSPENNQNAPIGLDLPLPIEPLYSTAALNSSESSVTPKIGLSYQMDDDNLFYATAAKGFRPAGASQRVPVTCNTDLVDFGYVDANGDPDQPFQYDSDTVWSYEVGTKNRLFDNRLALDASAYYIKWKDIQTGIFLPSCAESFTHNVAEAISTGFDIGIQANPFAGLALTASIGYNKSQFGADGRSPGGVVIVSEDAFVDGSPPPWVYSVSAQYDFGAFGGRDFYARTDVTHSSEQRRVGETDPNSPSFNEDLEPVEAYSIVNARIGMLLAGVDVSLFVNNLTDEQPSLNAVNSSALTGAQRYIWSDVTLRPRTYGVFASYRY